MTESCGENVPGTECIIQCCSIENQNSNKTYKCNFEAQATYNEETVYRDAEANTFKATDIRTVIVYPFQSQRICFNFGKSTTRFWSFESQSIKVTPQSCEHIISLTRSINSF